VRVSFKTKKLKKICDDERKMGAAYGSNSAKKIGYRLAELQAADSLDDISHRPPPRCHELLGTLKGTLSVDLAHPFRLLFTPDHEPVPTKPDGGLDRTKVTAVVIVGIEDTH
jgi:toxin HigB-1